MSKRSSKIIDLTTPKKAKRYFKKLAVEKCKNSKLSFQELKELPSEKIDELYNDLLKSEKLNEATV